MKRYNIEAGIDMRQRIGLEVEERPNGDWIKWEDANAEIEQLNEHIKGLGMCHAIDLRERDRSINTWHTRAEAHRIAKEACDAEIGRLKARNKEHVWGT